jgi:hypothetical protein
MRAREVQRSNIAGSWYPGDPAELRGTVQGFLAEARATADERVCAMVVPHAGYRYSGRCAGVAYARLPRGRWKRAAILAPSHYHFFEGGALYPGDGFETPLGVVEIDRTVAQALADSPGFFFADAPYKREHSVEIQLPFLQTIDPGLRVVPVLVGGELAPSKLTRLATGLRSLDDGETIFVVSSDFTHYGASFDYLPFPPSEASEVSDRLRQLDGAAIDLVRQTDATGFESYVQETGITICGRAPMAAFLRSAAASLAGEVVCYYTSLDVTGEYEHSVSYASIVFRPKSFA